MSSFSKADSIHAHEAEASAAHLVHEARSHLHDGIDALSERVTPPLSRASEQLSGLAHDGMDALRHRSRQVADEAQHVGELASSYVRHQPIKAVMIAMAGGALLMAVVSLLSRSRSRH